MRALINRHPGLRAALALPLAVRRRALAVLDRSALRTLDRLSELLADDVVVRLPAFGGEFALSPRSDLFRRIALTGLYEPELADLFRRHASGDIIDVGANVGFFTVLGAQSGRVLAIEPGEASMRRLRANVTRNGVADRVIFFDGLASDRSGLAELHVAAGKEEYASMSPLLHPSILGHSSSTETRQTSTIDELVGLHGLRPGLIKVDTEGAEGLVLKGAGETLRRHRPVVIAELADPLLRRTSGMSALDLVEMMESLGYDVRDPIRGKPGGAPYGDMLCVPRTAS